MPSDESQRGLKTKELQMEDEYRGCNICGVQTQQESGSHCNACAAFYCSGCKQDQTCLKCVQGWTIPWDVTEGSADAIEMERIKPGTKKLLEIGHRQAAELVEHGLHPHYVTQALMVQKRPIKRAPVSTQVDCKGKHLVEWCCSATSQFASF